MAGNAGAIRAGRAFVELFTDDSKLVRGLKAASGKLKAWGSTVTGMGMKLMAGGAAIVGPMLAATKTFMSAGDALDKMSGRVGASVEFLSALGHAAQIGGTEIAAMEVGIRRMQRTAYDASQGTKSAKDAFDQLGVSIYGADGQLKGTEQLFMDTAAAISRLDNNTQKAAIATIVFGRAGTSLLPMLKDGKDGLLGFMEEAKKLGYILTEEDTKAAAELTDAWTRLTSGAKMAAVQLGSALAPALQKAADSMRQWIRPVIDWVKENRELVVTVAKIGGTLAVAGAAAVAFGTVISSVGSIVGGAVIATKALGVALSFLAAHPAVAAVAAITAVIAVYYALSEAAIIASRAMTSYIDRQADARKEDWQRFQELQRLSEQQTLTSDQISRANGILGTLEARYGELGISIDEATGKINGMTDAQTRLNQVMRAHQVNEVRAKLRELDEQMAATREGIRAYKGWGLKGWFGMHSGELALFDDLKKLQDERLVTQAKLSALEADPSGKDMSDWEEAGESAGEAFSGGFQAAAEGNQALLDQIAQLQIEAIEQPLTKSLEEIEQKYREQMRRAKEAGQDLALVEEARELAIGNAIKAEERRIEVEREGARERAKAEAEAQAAEQERLKGAERTILERIEDLDLELTFPDEAERRIAKLQLAFKRLMAAAETDEAKRLLGVELGQRIELQQRFEGASKPSGFTAGTFSKFALGGLGMGGGPAERTAKATELTAREVQKVVRELIRQGQSVERAVFSE